MARVKIQLNRSAVRALLRGDEIQSDLEDRGQRIAAAAGPGHEVQTFVGRNRARVTVRTETFEARYAEATTRDLSNALDAGR